MLIFMVPDGIKKVELNDIFGKEFNGDFYISEIVDVFLWLWLDRT